VNMSCRVLSGSVIAEPFFRLAGAAANPRLAPDADGRADPVPPPEVAALHGRIVDLEHALQLDVRKAHDSGYRQGEEAGREQAALELQPVLQRLGTAITGVASLRSRIRRDGEQELVQLAIAIARRILRRELTVDPDAVEGLVRAALDKVQVRDVCRVRVHPAYLAALQKCLAHSAATAAVEMLSDPGLQPGDVVIETRRGDLDGCIETQLAEIERGFADRLKR
jgi:flagellar assembly protein FliH